ncbi:3'-phosphoadenosine 5'-phosphosulfate sulfotransferase (PAPS reductase)/FAD synthetase and related enzymes [Ceraceosorus bombacis]|uniref:FAD synthase n=1 Tax=Ceraceosorus bombacis TaxID=401625 RepID=A0A0N7L9Y3_9BASI|nr:3'-phosphoadenosine 5'-phosphosulfate sulfotransferase (PAPS reductase)/FAD synthetase and related enzymes [Ceraceosorus bombacis]
MASGDVKGDDSAAQAISSSNVTAALGEAVIDSEWLASIDAVYAIFEKPQLSSEHQRLAGLVKKAVSLVEEVILECGIEQVALSYNGGKDCNVLIHLICAVLRRTGKRRTAPSSKSASPSPSHPLQPLPAVYITCESPFQQVEDFVTASRQRYNLDLVRVRGGMRSGLEDYLSGKGQRRVGFETSDERNSNGHSVKAIFVGTRRTDPHGNTLTDRKPTDPGWPQVERVHPILDWKYADVWTFLRCPLFGKGGAGLTQQERDRTATANAIGVPYCVLYDEGYTSLGSTFNTFPNPVLRDANSGTWRPAHELQDEALERAGRQSQAPLSV